MFAKIFSRSNPINFAIIGSLIVIFAILSIFRLQEVLPGFQSSYKHFLAIPFLVFSVFVLDFIIKKNNLNKADNYAILLFGLLLLLIPRTFIESKIIIANLFILLAFRRLASLHSQKQVKQKLFDAALYVSLATFFEFWSILFFILIYTAIIIHLASDIKNWLVPIIGAIAMGTLFLLVSLLFDTDWIAYVYHKSYYDFSFSYFRNLFHLLSTGTFISIALLLIGFQLLNLKSHLIIIQNSLKKVIIYTLIALSIYLIASEKNNGYLLFTITPMAIMGSNFLSSIQKEWIKNAILSLLLILVVLCYFLHL